MSVVEYPEKMNSNDVQIWDNAAFDNGGDSGSSPAMKLSWSDMKPLSSINLSNQSFESDCTKENRSPSLVDSPISIKSLASINPLKVANVAANAGPKSVPKMGVYEKKSQKGFSQDSVLKENGVLEERDLDSEIEEIEKEISKLSSRLESLRLEKAKRNAKVMERRGRIVAAKFMDPPKQGIRSSDEERKSEESMNVSGKLKTPRRGMSLGPAEIMRGMRRGISLGPAEIYSATKLKQLGRQEITPVQPSANRRKSCYWKLQDIDELRATKQRGKSMSLSPKSRSKTVTKPQIPKQAATTITSKKTVKKEDGVLSSIQPKKLFVKDSEKSASAKKPLKNGRVVPSRYNQVTSGGSSALKELRKRSWPENEEEIKRSEKKRVSLVAKCEGAEQPATESRVKKRWDIPSEVAVQKNVDHRTPSSVTKILEAVPKIKTFRCTNESPRDSGPAKRVSELVGKKSFFSMDDGGENPDDESVCQALSFEEEATKENLKIRVLRCINESPRNSGAAKRVSQLVGRRPFFAADDDNDMPVFSFEEEDAEQN